MSNATTSETSGAGVLSGDDDNLLNDILQITTWILLALTSLMMCFRLLTRYFLRKHDILHDWDDILLLLSYVSLLSSRGRRVPFYQDTCPSISKEGVEHQRFSPDLPPET